MKALTISFSSDKTDCKKLFLAWFRHSRSNVIRISLLALIGFALLFEIWSPFYLRTFNVPPQEYFSLLFFVMAACMFMLFCIPFVVVMPRIRYRTFLYTVDNLKKSGTTLKEVTFLEDALKLDLVLYGFSSQKSDSLPPNKKMYCASFWNCVLFPQRPSSAADSKSSVSL